VAGVLILVIDAYTLNTQFKTVVSKQADPGGRAVQGRSLVGISGSNPTGGGEGHSCLSLASVAYC
jgi:hypothetical protein